MSDHADTTMGFAGAKLAEFTPVPRYLSAMDTLIYLTEDVAYRAVRLSGHAIALLHPQENRPVGVRFNGIRFLNQRYAAILKAAGVETTGHPIDLAIYWELALTILDDKIETKPADAARHKQIKTWIAEIIQGAPAIQTSEFASAA